MILPARDWDEAGIGDDDIAIRQQDQIAVYWNKRGEVVIRQHSWPDDDTIILIAPENAEHLADAILRCAAELTGNHHADEVAPARRDRTAAERMRRYRRNKRNSRNDTVVDLPFAPPIDQDGEVLAG